MELSLEALAVFTVFEFMFNHDFENLLTVKVTTNECNKMPVSKALHRDRYEKCQNVYFSHFVEVLTLHYVIMPLYMLHMNLLVSMLWLEMLLTDDENNNTA